MRNALRMAAAFVQRDFRIATSYRFHFMFQLASGFFIVATFFFVSKLVGSAAATHALDRYQTDYFSFVLIGVAAQGLLDAGLAGFTGRLRTAMTEGTLEMMFACSVPGSWILVMPCLWSFFFEAVTASVVVGFGIVAFGADLAQANLLAGAVAVLLTMSAYSVFGLLSASVILIVKRGDPINWAFAHVSALVAGAYFPVELFPDWLAGLAQILPMTHAYRAMRMTLLSGAGFADIWFELVILAGVSAVGLPLALRICGRAIERAKREGSLGTF